MDNIKIYTPDNELLLDVPVDDSSLRYKEIMGDNNLTLNFSLSQFVKSDNFDGIPLFSYTTFKNERYTLYAPENFTKQHSEHFDYTLVLEAYQAYMKYVKFKFITVERTPGQADKIVGAPKLKSSLTLTPADFAQVLVDCMNFADPDKGWIVGECLSSEPVTIDFNHEYCYSMMQKIADAFETEWEVDGKTIHFRKVEKMKNTPVDLSYGMGSGILPGISRRQYDDSKIVNRVWIEGSDRNVNGATYGNETLLLLKNDLFMYEGSHYVTDETGSYIEPLGRLGALYEDSLDLTKIYPSRVGTISEVIAVNDSQGLWDFKDASIPENLDFSKMVLPGETMTVIFQTGVLAGKEFDVKYIHDERRFLIVPETDSGMTIPKGVLIPEVGNTYAVFHISLPEEYILSAELKARNEAVKYLHENRQPRYTYEWNLDGIFAKQNWGALGGFMQPGFHVLFSDPQFLPDPVAIRIINVKEYVNKPLAPTIQLSNNVTGRSVASVLTEIPRQEQTIDRKADEVYRFAKRRYNDSQELIEAMYDPSGNFQNDVISSLIIENMMLRQGDSTLQFKFLNTTWQNEIEPNFYFDVVTKRFNAPVCRMRHMTMEIDTVRPDRPISEYCHWLTTAFISDVLTKTDTPYYFYVQCSKTLSLVNGRRQGSAKFLISETKIALEEVAGYYTFWVGFLNSEFEGNRSYRTMYGYSEFLPGQATLNNFYSTDGNSYIKLLANQFRFGGQNTALEWNVGGDGLLRLKGAMVQSQGGTTSEIGVFLGEYNNSKVYYKGDEVTYQGSTYRCIYNTDDSGFPPTDTYVWTVVAQKGTTPYTWVRYADSASGVGFSASPLNKAYVGFAYNKPTQTASNTPSDYAWSLIKGTDGIPGAPGEDGKTTYTWLKYSDYADGSNLYDVPTANTKYIGLAINKTTPTESTNKADYTWSKIKGEDGKDGLDGTDGKNGRTFSYRGDYSASKSYKGNSEVAEVVKYNNAYYYTLDNAGTITGIAPNNTSKWVIYGASFESVATGLLFADKATIAGLDFYNHIINSTKLDSNGEPMISIDGINGFIKAMGLFSTQAPNNTDKITVGYDESTWAQANFRLFNSENQRDYVRISKSTRNTGQINIGELGKNTSIEEATILLNGQSRMEVDATGQQLLVLLSNLPTSPIGLPSGALYKSGDTIKITT